MRTCSNCGSEIGPGDDFCGNCGTRKAAGFADSTTAAVGPMLKAATEPAAAYYTPRQPAYGADTASVSTRAGETIEQKYLRQTRNATVFIAVIVGIVTVITVVGVIWTVTNISKLNSQLNGVNGISSCESQGGTNPNC